MGIMDGVLAIIVGVIGFGIVLGFITGMNADQMDETQLMILGAIPTFFLLMILYGVFRMIKSGGKGI